MSAPPEKNKDETEEKKGAARLSLRDKLTQTFSRPSEPDKFKANLRQTLSQAPATPDNLPSWSGKKFSSQSLSDGDDSAPGGNKLVSFARRRPLTASLVLMTAVLILAVDMLVLARHLNLTTWNPIGLGGNGPITGAASWEARDSGLSLLDRLGETSADDYSTYPNSSATGGANNLAGGLVQPELPAGLGGIVNPDDKEEKKKLKKAGGVDLGGSELVLGGMAQGMDRMQLKEGGGYAAASGGGAGGASRSTYFGNAGNNLENFAAVNNPVKQTESFMGADVGAFPTSNATTESEIAEEMLGDVNSISDDIKKYMQEGTWRMRRLRETKSDFVEWDKDARGMLLSSYAFIQMTNAQALGNDAYKCPTCSTEGRINESRSTFYGERYDRK